MNAFETHKLSCPKFALETISNVAGIQAAGGGPCLGFVLDWILPVVGSEDLRLLGKLVGEEVCPLGSASMSLLFLCESGKAVYLDWDWIFFNLFEDLAGLCNWVLANDYSGVVLDYTISPSERPLDLQ